MFEEFLVKKCMILDEGKHRQCYINEITILRHVFVA